MCRSISELMSQLCGLLANLLIIDDRTNYNFAFDPSSAAVSTDEPLGNLRYNMYITLHYMINSFSIY